MTLSPRLAPLLVVRSALRALEFYVRVLGATEIARYLHPVTSTLGHADLTLGGAVFSVTEETPAWGAVAPPSLGGSPVVLQLLVDDVDASLAATVREGASVVFPAQEFCGERMARIRDPFGHLWILRQRLEELSPEEIQRRRDAFFAETQRTR